MNQKINKCSRDINGLYVGRLRSAPDALGRIASTLFMMVLPFITIAQENRLAPQQPNTAEIYHQIEKLGFLGTALYIAAHPDDENTRLISWLANDVQARTAYLSLTRGDGGQNLIGPELREQLGMIRTQELLEARNIDGGNQFFTRANDFGYSKNPEETLDIWNKDEVLNDVVRVIRRFQPDVIINRFNHRTPGTTHGHHTSSAMLSMEAFDLVGKSSYETLGEETWQPERVFFNTSWWFYGSQEAFDQAMKEDQKKGDKAVLRTIDVGTYYNFKGLSNNEIAALSRSKHKSQGFGSSGSRGRQTEYLEFLKGSNPTDKSDLFSGINTTWTRVKGGSKIQTLLNQILSDYNFKKPTASLDHLLELHEAISELKDSHWKNIKLADLEELILDITGFYAQASVDDKYATTGETLEINVETTNRSELDMSVNFVPTDTFKFEQVQVNIDGFERENTKATLSIPPDAPYSTPYYLEKEGSMGMYAVEDVSLIGKPEEAPIYQVALKITIMGKTIEKSIPVVHKRTDPVRGEIIEPLQIVPAVSVKIAEPVYIFGSGESQKIEVIVTAFKDVKNLSPSVITSDDWDTGMRIQQVYDLKKGEQRSFNFQITAPKEQSETELQAKVFVNGDTYDQEVITIDYQHIPNQQLVRKATAQLVNPNLKNNASTIAYINGAGDAVPAALEAMGSTVFTYDPTNVPADLSKYDAVVVGIRAYNIAAQEMANLQPRLAAFVQGGGTLVQQYNTSRRIPDDAMGPLKISLSRKRTTDENAQVSLLAKDHPVLNYPNKITQADFEGWVQERGLYFPDAWDDAFVPVLGMSDAGEEMTRGSLIVAPYGEGHVVYTGLSFFRELPAGVSGAYRLFANIINLGTQPEINNTTDEKQ